MTKYIQAITTTDTEENAAEIVNSLIRHRHAACVQIVGPIQSTYWWEEKIETATEWLCIIKTRRDRFEQVEAAIRRIHANEVPEIIAIPIIEGNEDYLAWLDKAVQ